MMPVSSRVILAAIAFLLPLACRQHRMAGAAAQVDGVAPHFVAAQQDFPREEKNLRKWDAPVVADLDQDGFLDLILNDHGFGVRICWNNQGRYAKPYDLVMGDTHGISVGDFDQDGNQEMIISPGGGAGSNARNAKVYRADRQRKFVRLPEFKVPLRTMRGRTVKFMDGDNDGDLDLIDFAFPSREKLGESENYLYENDGQGQLVLAGVLPPIKADGQKTLITDFDGDNQLDLLLYGHGHVKAYQASGDLTYKDVTDSVLRYRIEHVTCMVEIDYDNDGDADLFLTRGREFDVGETFYNRQTLTWAFFTKRGPFQFKDLIVGDVLKIENYQAQWPNKSLFIGESAYEYEFPGETHSGRDIRLVNSDALGWPDKTSEKGTYIGYVGNEAWRLAGDIWSPTTGVIHGVRSYPKSDHPPGLNDILLENQEGRFVDVTTRVNLQLEEHTTGAAVADFDNNGFQDLLIIRRGELVHANESLVYLNHGEAGFVPLEDHNIVSPELGAIGMGAEALDYNRDGKVDVLIGNERGKWHLFRNQMRAADQSNYLVVAVGNPKSGRASPLGALVEVKAGDNLQAKRVGATGAAYSLSHNAFMHFGLGASEGPVDVKVTWTNGESSERSVSNLNRIARIGRDAASPSQAKPSNSTDSKSMKRPHSEPIAGADAESGAKQ